MKHSIKRNTSNTVLIGDHEQVLTRIKPKWKGFKKIILPVEFDGRKVWKGLLAKVIDQGSCGSCWAFASTQCLQDRFRIQSRGVIDIELSPTLLLICDQNNNESHSQSRQGFSCFGNTLIQACIQLYKKGVSTEKCLPYFNPLGDSKSVSFKRLKDIRREFEIPFCKYITSEYEDMCADYFYNEKTNTLHGKPIRFWRAKNVFIPYYKFGDDYFIKYSIWKWGPVVTAMEVYSDFYFYKKGTVYKHNPDAELVSGHSVVIVGWGYNYWICRNTWGDKWGDGGYFLIEKGKNECKIEENVVLFEPDFFNGYGHVVKDPNFRIAGIMTAVKRDENIDPYTGISLRNSMTQDFIEDIKTVERPDTNTFVAARVSLKTDNRWIIWLVVISLLVVLYTIGL